MLHHAMRRLPMAFVPNLGARLAWLNIRFIDPVVARKARQTIRQHIPAMPAIIARAEIFAFPRPFCYF